MCNKGWWKSQQQPQLDKGHLGMCDGMQGATRWGSAGAGAGRGRQTAGERAAQVLPAVLELVEACIDALAQDCEAAEAIASGRPVLHATLQTFSDKWGPAAACRLPHGFTSMLF